MVGPVLQKRDLVELLKENRTRIQQFGVRRLGLFGSFVREQQRADSDVDLLVEFRPEEKSFENFMNLSFLLEDLLNRRVEIVTAESLSPYIGPHITKETEYVL